MATVVVSVVTVVLGSVVVRALDGVWAGVAVSDSKAAIGLEFGVLAGARVEIGAGAVAEVRRGVATGGVESKAARVVAVTGAGIVVVVGAAAVTCRTSFADRAASVSSFACSALRSSNAFRTPSGNGPDRVSAQSRSMRASSASIFSTESMSSSALADDMAGFCVGSGTGECVAAFGSTIAFVVIGVLNSFL